MIEAKIEDEEKLVSLKNNQSELNLKMRDFTPQEALDYQAHLLKISKPTGENFYDELQ